mgnify:CR=1 FL=1
MGHLPYLAYYLVCVLAAASAQTLADTQSIVPMVGASGAIAGVLGGYIFLYPRARVDVLIIFIIFWRIFPAQAWIVLGLWFGTQVVAGVVMPADAGGVAYLAHVGGFLAGLALVALIYRVPRIGQAEYDQRPVAQTRLVPLVRRRR